jgi:hypothetical protein
MKMTTKNIVVLESFITLGSLDCDCTLPILHQLHKKKGYGPILKTRALSNFLGVAMMMYQTLLFLAKH